MRRRGLERRRRRKRPMLRGGCDGGDREGGGGGGAATGGALCGIWPSYGQGVDDDDEDVWDGWGKGLWGEAEDVWDTERKREEESADASLDGHARAGELHSFSTICLLWQRPADEQVEDALVELVARTQDQGRVRCRRDESVPLDG